MKKLNIAIITISDSRTVKTDKSGKKLKDLIQKSGHKVKGKLIVPDNIYQIRSVASKFIADKNIDVIIKIKSSK